MCVYIYIHTYIYIYIYVYRYRYTFVVKYWPLCSGRPSLASAMRACARVSLRSILESAHLPHWNRLLERERCRTGRRISDNVHLPDWNHICRIRLMHLPDWNHFIILWKTCVSPTLKRYRTGRRCCTHPGNTWRGPAGVANHLSAICLAETNLDPCRATFCKRVKSMRHRFLSSCCSRGGYIYI